MKCQFFQLRVGSGDGLGYKLLEVTFIEDITRVVISFEIYRRSHRRV